MIDNYNNKANFPHKILLTNGQVLRLHKSFPNNSSGKIKLSKTKLSKSGGLLGKLLELLLKADFLLRKNVLKTLVKSVLIPLGLTAINNNGVRNRCSYSKKIFGSYMRSSDLAKRTTLIISNEEIVL